MILRAMFSESMGCIGNTIAWCIRKITLFVLKIDLCQCSWILLGYILQVSISLYLEIYRKRSFLIILSSSYLLQHKIAFHWPPLSAASTAHLVVVLIAFECITKFKTITSLSSRQKFYMVSKVWPIVWCKDHLNLDAKRSKNSTGLKFYGILPKESYVLLYLIYKTSWLNLTVIMYFCSCSVLYKLKKVPEKHQNLNC